MGEPWGIGNSVANVGRAVGPGIGAAIVTIAAANLPAGTYKIDTTIAYGSGVDGTVEQNNMELRAGATTITGLIITDTPQTVGYLATLRRVLDGSTALSINATAAGTVTATYLAQIVATRIL